MKIRTVNGLEVRNDTARWCECDLDEAEFFPGDVVAFYPSVNVVMMGIAPRVVKINQTIDVAGAPVVIVGDEKVKVEVWIFNPTGGTFRLDKNAEIGRLVMVEESSIRKVSLSPVKAAKR